MRWLENYAESGRSFKMRETVSLVKLIEEREINDG